MNEWLLPALKGLVIGVAVAAPVGPVGILVVRRALAERPWSGFVAGLGAAFGDAVFAAIAGFGLTAVSTLLETWQRPLRIGGGIVIIAMGIALLAHMRMTHSVKRSGSAVEASLMSSPRAAAAAFALTLANPVTLLSFVAIFAAAGLSQEEPSFAGTGVLVGSVFCGSAVWFLLLSRSAYLVSQRYGERAARFFDGLAAVLLIALGLLALLAL